MIIKLIGIILTLFFMMASHSFAAEMASANYIISSSVMNSTGLEKSSSTYKLLDSVGQSTPTGVSNNNVNAKLEGGFLYGTQFAVPLDQTATSVITALGDILINNQTLTNQQRKSIELAIKFLQDALNAFALYQAGDINALTNAMNKTKSAINKLIASGVAETEVYQQMLAQAAELAVTTEINRIASIAGDANAFVIQARVFLSAGSTALLSFLYSNAVQSFTQAYNEALLAV
jgi:hypothetical protein